MELFDYEDDFAFPASLEEEDAADIECNNEEEEGILMSCGRSTENQLGFITRENVQWYFRPIRGLSRITQVSTGANHTLALDALGRIWTWGQGSKGCLGLGGTQSRVVPTLIPELNQVAIVATGLQSSYSACVTKSGNLFCWGNNEHGQFGLGTQHAQQLLTPKRIPLNHTVSLLACGEKHILLVDTNNALLSAGCNKSGACGNSYLTHHTKFTKVGNNHDTKRQIRGIACGTDTSYYWNGTEGQAFMFGGGGDGETTTVSFRDFSVIVSKISCSASHVLFLTEDGRVFSRKAHKRGTPERIHFNTPIVDVACGSSGQLGCVDEDGNVYTWGKGQSLGGEVDLKLKPALVDRVLGARRLACGRDFTVCLIGFTRPGAAQFANKCTSLVDIVERSMVEQMDGFNFATCFEYATRHNFSPLANSPLEQACIDFVLENYAVLKLVNPIAIGKLCVEEEEEEEQEEELVVVDENDAEHIEEQRIILQLLEDCKVKEEEEEAATPSPPQQKKHFCQVCNIEMIDKEAHEAGKRHRAAFRRMFAHEEETRPQEAKRKGKKQVFSSDASSPCGKSLPTKSAPWSISPNNNNASSVRDLLSSATPPKPTQVPSSPAAVVGQSSSLPSCASWAESKSPTVRLEFAYTKRQVIHVTKAPPPPTNAVDKKPIAEQQSSPRPQSLREIVQLEESSQVKKTVRPLERSAWGYVAKRG